MISLLGVREMWVAVLDKNAATRGRKWDGEEGRIEVKEGWDMVVQVLLLLSYLTQGSWIRMISVDLCAR